MGWERGRVAHRLLIPLAVDLGVIATAEELFQARHYPGVIAMATDALDDEPECVPLLLIRARAQMALRRDLDAQGDLRDVIRLDATCAPAFRLLGELAARRDETKSAITFFREALRLDPDDQEARDWLQIVESVRPAAVAQKLPASATAAGRFPRTERLAKGTQTPADWEGTTQPFARGSSPAPMGPPAIAPGRFVARAMAPAPAEPIDPPKWTLTKRPMSRTATPELPGFGEYLVASGILTRERLRAAQAYQRSMKVQLTTAIVTLGLATPQRIEWACVAHQTQVGRDRQS